MKQIQIDYLLPYPDPSVKFYELKTTWISRDFLEKLVNRDGKPYFIDFDGDYLLFLGGQYSYQRIQNILKKHE